LSISLAPLFFKRTIRLLEPTITFKSVEAEYLLKKKNGGLELLQDYLEDPRIIPEDLSSIQVSSLNITYREMVFYSLEYSEKRVYDYCSRITMYIFYFSIHENAMFYWARIVSNKLSFQLGNFRKNKKFYMSSYLSFTIAYYYIFKKFPLDK